MTGTGSPIGDPPGAAARGRLRRAGDPPRYGDDIVADCADVTIML